MKNIRFLLSIKNKILFSFIVLPIICTIRISNEIQKSMFIQYYIMSILIVWISVYLYEKTICESQIGVKKKISLILVFSFFFAGYEIYLMKIQTYHVIGILFVTLIAVYLFISAYIEDLKASRF